MKVSFSSKISRSNWKHHLDKLKGYYIHKDGQKNDRGENKTKFTSPKSRSELQNELESRNSYLELQVKEDLEREDSLQRWLTDQKKSKKLAKKTLLRIEPISNESTTTTEMMKTVNWNWNSKTTKSDFVWELSSTATLFFFFFSVFSKKNDFDVWENKNDLL